jgi:hypothetical protein
VSDRPSRCLQCLPVRRSAYSQASNAPGCIGGDVQDSGFDKLGRKSKCNTSYRSCCELVVAPQGQGKNRLPLAPRSTPRPPQGGSGAVPSNITRHYAKWPHARTSLVNAATSHNAALCVNGPEGSPPNPRRGLNKVASRFIRSPAHPAVSKRALQPLRVFRPPFSCLPPIRPQGLPRKNSS